MFFDAFERLEFGKLELGKMEIAKLESAKLESAKLEPSKVKTRQVRAPCRSSPKAARVSGDTTKMIRYRRSSTFLFEFRFGLSDSL